METDFTYQLECQGRPDYELVGWEEIVLWWLLRYWGIY